jgi:long-chain fatty acid transport protein
VRKWDDTWRVALGAQYQLDDKWLLQGGVSYNSSPVDDEDRTSDLPIDEQYRICFGAEYKLSANLTIGGNRTYVDLGDARIESAEFSGEYDSNHLVMLGIFSKWTWCLNSAS